MLYSIIDIQVNESKGKTAQLSFYNRRNHRKPKEYEGSPKKNQKNFIAVISIQHFSNKKKGGKSLYIKGFHLYAL